ncbi:MAG: hypothetical protein AAGD18_00735 [Actinomycetota bacterium]
MAEPSTARRGGPNGRTGRPAAHTRDQVVDAAVAMGLRNVSVAGVARVMGIPAATVYTYVSGRDDLERAVADRVLDGVIGDVADGDDPVEVAVGWGLSLYGVAMGHPGLAEYYLSHAWPSLLLFEERFGAALVEAGFVPAAAVLLTDAVVSTAMGEAVARQAEDLGEDREFEDSFGLDRPVHTAGLPIAWSAPESDRFAWKLRWSVVGMVDAIRREVVPFSGST